MASRRIALLGGAALLLSGCESIQDLADSVLATRKEPLPGTRIPVISMADRQMRVDADAANRRLTLPEPTVNADWLQPGGNVSHSPGHPALPRPLGEVWRTSIGSGMGYRQRLTAQPIATADTLYAMDAFGWITALDIARGGRRWQADTRPRRDRDGALGGGMAMADGTLYAVTGLAEVMAINPENGEIRWRARLAGAARGGIAVAGGRIFIPTVSNAVLCHSIEDGRQLWAYTGQETRAIALGLAAPAVADDLAVCGMPSGELVALRVADGRPAWSESLASNRAAAASMADLGAIVAMPVIDRGRVFAIGLGGSAIALDLRSGRRVWERDVGGIATPWSAGDWVFLLSLDNQVMSLGRDDGRVRWITQLPRFLDERRNRNPISWGPPVLAGGRLLVAGSNAQLFELEATDGEIGARLRMPAGAQIAPAISNGSAYYMADNGVVIALRGVG